MIGITYIGQFSAGICKDAGHQATAAQIELFCRLSVTGTERSDPSGTARDDSGVSGMKGLEKGG